MSTGPTRDLPAGDAPPRGPAGRALSWIGRAPHAPYFVDEEGRDWTPVGQNDSISWLELEGLLHRRDLPGVARHLRWLADHGVTCLRLMLEYAQTGEHFFEQPAGRFNPALVGLWDDLFRLAEQAGLRLLLTPLDTFFHYVRWDIHPYNVANGGPCSSRTRLMCCPDTRALIKQRLAFAARRWGGSGALFAWDIWNEMHPVQGEDRPGVFEDYIEDVGPFLRATEQAAHGRAHLQTASVFGPELHWKPWLNRPIFRHPLLDFATNHFYEEGTIDHPADTVAPARAAGRLVREALAEIEDARPFFESEHGPIHSFKDHGLTLSEPFDDEYFRHFQWAHLASGGAGGGMRWPNRAPHRLTDGMRRAQRALAGFLPLVRWRAFRRAPLDVGCSDANAAVFACADADQAVLFVLRTAPLLGDGRVDPALRPGPVLTLPFTRLCARSWDPVAGRPGPALEGADGRLALPPFGVCLALAVRRRD